MLLVGQSRDRFPVVSLGIFSVVRPTEPCALRSTQPLKVSTRDSSWGKGGRCVWLTTYHPCSAETSRKSGALIYLEPLGPPRPVLGNIYLTLYIYIYIYIYIYTHIHKVMLQMWHHDTIGNRTRDLPACNALPQGSEPQRASFILQYISNT